MHESHPSQIQEECIRWEGATDRVGYGLTAGSDRKLDARAHRAAYIRAKGPIPPEHEIHHVCKNPRCVNPEHLKALSQREHDLEHFLHEKAGLTIEDVLAIRRRGRVMGVTAGEVADEFGIWITTVYKYWAADCRWRDLLDDEPGPAVPTDPCLWCGGKVDRVTVNPTTNRRAERTTKFCSIRCRQTFNNARRKVAA